MANVIPAYDHIFQDAVDETGYGEAFDCGGLAAVRIQVTGTFSATVIWQGTIDGENWVDVGAIQQDDLVWDVCTSIPGIWILPAAGLDKIRCSVNWVSGTSVTVTGKGMKVFSPAVAIGPRGCLLLDDGSFLLLDNGDYLEIG